MKKKSNNEFASSSTCLSLGEMFIMMTSAISLEDQVWIIANALEELMKSIQEKEAFREQQMFFILQKINGFSNQHNDLSDSSKDSLCQKKQDYFVKEWNSSKTKQSHPNSVVSTSQLNEFVKEVIEDQVNRGLQTFFSYVKNHRIDLLKMPQNYQPHEF